jgi:anaerobic selenocysteine-containing dehydrogenase
MLLRGSSTIEDHSPRFHGPVAQTQQAKFEARNPKFETNPKKVRSSKLELNGGKARSFKRTQGKFEVFPLDLFRISNFELVSDFEPRASDLGEVPVWVTRPHAPGHLHQQYEFGNRLRVPIPSD